MHLSYWGHQDIIFKLLIILSRIPVIESIKYRFLLIWTKVFFYAASSFSIMMFILLMHMKFLSPFLGEVLNFWFVKLEIWIYLLHSLRSLCTYEIMGCFFNISMMAVLIAPFKRTNYLSFLPFYDLFRFF